MTSGLHGPYAQGCTRATMANTMGGEAVRRSKSPKVRPSSDCRLEPACMKSESLVIADQECRGEYVLGSCTHRPSSSQSENYLKAGNGLVPFLVKGGACDGS